MVPRDPGPCPGDGLAGPTLFLAGPPDVVPEEDPLAAFEGAAVPSFGPSPPADGAKLAERDLASEPIFDGLCAAGGRLYLATKTGEVLCFGKSQ